jgi:hypothetical protein
VILSVRHIGKYAEVLISSGSGTIVTSLLDKAEQKQLADAFRGVADELDTTHPTETPDEHA